MSSSTFPLKKIARVKGGKRLPIGTSLQSAKNSHPYLRIVDMGDKYISKTSLQYVPDEVFPRIARYITSTNDILLSIVGTIGLVSLVDSELDSASLTENCVKLTLTNNDFVPEFLYYYLSSAPGQHEIKIRQVGSTQPKLPIYNIEQIPIPALNKKQQEFIAKILGDLDRKIDLNRRMNETLEEMGQVLFNHYFVDNSENKNWKEGQISDIAEYKRITRKPQEEQEETFQHFSIPAYDACMYPELVLGSEILSNKFQVTNNSILVSKLNPSTSRIWPVFDVTNNAVCSTEFVCLKPYKYYSFLYFLLNSRIYKNTTAAAAGGTSNSHKRVSPEFINAFSFPMPPENLIEKFEISVGNFLHNSVLNTKTNNTLAGLRDTLMPKLIRGEIKV